MMYKRGLLFGLGICLWMTGFTQDTLFYDTLIKSQAGEFLSVKYTSQTTGIEEELCLRNGKWSFYGKDDQLLKVAHYKANGSTKMSVLQGEVNYFDVNGDTVLHRRYHRDQPIKTRAYRELVIIEGTAQWNVVKQYGNYVVFEHLNRFRQPRLQSEFINLRGADQLGYYESTEERLASTHLLDSAHFWPNDSRNLIANPMFEDHPKLVASTASIKDGMESWKPASPTPDFYLSEDCKSGTGCLGFRVFSLVKDIEYLQNKLVKPLKKDSFYCFSLYVKLANQCSYTSNGLGIHFSKKPVDDEDIEEIVLTKPNLLLNENYLPYKTKWMLLQCTYKAKGGEKYATIGSFKKLREIALTPVNGSSAEAYYIIDDVSLIPVKDSSLCKCNLDDVPVKPKLMFYDTLKQDTGWIQKPSPGYRFVLENVYFQNDKYDLLSESISSLYRLYNLLQKYPDMKIEISGHTSSLGSYEHNVELSRKRARAVRNFLQINGVDKDRLRIKGFGPKEPIASNDTPDGQALNRRVEVKVLTL